MTGESALAILSSPWGIMAVVGWVIWALVGLWAVQTVGLVLAYAAVWVAGKPDEVTTAHG